MHEHRQKHSHMKARVITHLHIKARTRMQTGNGKAIKKYDESVYSTHNYNYTVSIVSPVSHVFPVSLVSLLSTVSLGSHVSPVSHVSHVSPSPLSPLLYSRGQLKQSFA